MNKMQKLMAAIEELQRMHGHCQAVQVAVPSTAANKAVAAIEADIAELRRQLVEAINAQPDTHSLTPHA